MNGDEGAWRNRNTEEGVEGQVEVSSVPRHCGLPVEVTFVQRPAQGERLFQAEGRANGKMEGGACWQEGGGQEIGYSRNENHVDSFFRSNPMTYSKTQSLS